MTNLSDNSVPFDYLAPGRGRVYGSAGDFDFDLRTGAVTTPPEDIPADYSFARGGRVDIGEFTAFWNRFTASGNSSQALACLDILDARIIDKAGTGFDAEPDWRADVLADWLLECDKQLRARGFAECAPALYLAVAGRLAEEFFGLEESDLDEDRAAEAQKACVTPLTFVMEFGALLELVQLRPLPV